ncbi:MAG: PSP1 domain-containing protein [Desulfovibrionaceae bacterium]
MYIGIVSPANKFLEYYKNPYCLQLKKGDEVIVEDVTRDFVFAVVASFVQRLPSFIKKESLQNIVRLAGSQDKKNNEKALALATTARAFCFLAIKDLMLDMKIIRVECTLDLKKLFFYFTALDRVDFRELVRVLAEKYKMRIELRQISVRYEAQLLGSLGGCGRESCCSSHMRTFKPVNIKMAKDQNIFLNSTKTSGACGRLLCCLGYEQDSYEYYKSVIPEVGKSYLTKLGKVSILKINFSTNSIELRRENNQVEDVLFNAWEDLCVYEI